jgi:hypothetical protein
VSISSGQLADCKIGLSLVQTGVTEGAMTLLETNEPRRCATSMKMSELLQSGPNPRRSAAIFMAGTMGAIKSDRWWKVMVGGSEPGQDLSLWQHPYFNNGRSRW